LQEFLQKFVTKFCYDQVMPNETVPTSVPVTKTVTEVQAIRPAPRTIYDASSGEIFWKNFVAGLGHAIGGVVIYIIFLAIMVMSVVRFLWPIVQPYVQLYRTSMESLQKIQSTLPSNPFGNTTPQNTTNGSGEVQQSWSFEVSPDQLRSFFPQQSQQPQPSQAPQQ
jgi:hypothetical protein